MNPRPDPETSLAAESASPTPPGTPPEDDPRVVQAVQEYMAAMESGNPPDRQEYLARHPEIAEVLADCLEALEFVQAVAPRLDAPGILPPPDATDTRASGEAAAPLGDFRILREIGRGGMGVVYEAEQLSLGRRVALKVLPFACTLDPKHLQRFKNEARAAAQLHHTHIVPVYFVGVERGVHFYAMQYIEGQSLAEVIRELHQLGHPEGPLDHPAKAVRDPQGGGERLPRHGITATEAVAGSAGRVSWETASVIPKSLTTEASVRGKAFFQAAAQLGVQAAEALEHAHQLGVVHRDIKPGNLLVEGHGHLWVSDFGLAQFQSDAALTATGDVVGTLRYMSPEMALAKRQLVDHRTDIYSLGATLYELLTLQPPFEGADREELLRQIAFSEPRPLQRLNPAVPADLETIVLKAMAKRVEDRYGTAQDLAEDLRRFLQHRPVLARRPTLLQRGAKWARRHQSVVAAAVILLVLASVGLALATAMLARERWKTRQALDAEAHQLARAERSFRQAREVVDLFTELSEEQLADKPELQRLRRRLLGVSLEYYQDFIDQRQDDPSQATDLAASYLRVATILDEMGNREKTLEALEQAHQLHQKQARSRLAETQATPEGSAGSSVSGGWALYLLAQKAVQADLKLTSSQAKQVEALLQSRRQVFREFRTISPDSWHTKVAELAAQEKALADLLLPSQAARLRQIQLQLALQMRGPEAFNKPDVAAGLRLSGTQRDTIRALQEELRQSWRAAHQAGPQGPDRMKKLDALVKRTREEALALLSDEQRARWREMTGEPFKADLLPPPRGPSPRASDPRQRPGP